MVKRFYQTQTFTPHLLPTRIGPGQVVQYVLLPSVLGERRAPSGVRFGRYRQARSLMRVPVVEGQT